MAGRVHMTRLMLGGPDDTGAKHPESIMGLIACMA